MPFALVFIGLVMIVSGAKDTYRELGAELVSDFTGDGNFTFWIVAVGAVGAVGYIPALRTFSRLFMGLIILSMVLSNRGVFGKFNEALNSGPETITPTERASTSTDDAPGANSIDKITNLISAASSKASATAQDNFRKTIDVARLLFMGA